MKIHIHNMGGSWCDCQHRPGSAVPGGRPEASGDGREHGSATGEDGEPPVNWVRQG